MLIAPKVPTGPEWKPIMGAQFLFDPIDRPLIRRARRAALKAMGEDEHGPEPEDDLESLETLGDAISHAIIMGGVRDWKDVGQQRFDDEGAPVLDEDDKPIFDVLPFSAENLALILTDAPTFDAIDAVYVMPYAQRQRVKNASAASPSGIGGAATPDSDTASSAATPPRKGGAKRVRIGKTPRQRRKQTVSGTS